MRLCSLLEGVGDSSEGEHNYMHPQSACKEPASYEAVAAESSDFRVMLENVRAGP